jgi:hypothetical protein
MSVFAHSLPHQWTLRICISHVSAVVMKIAMLMMIIVIAQGLGLNLFQIQNLFEPSVSWLSTCYYSGTVFLCLFWYTVKKKCKAIPVTDHGGL